MNVRDPDRFDESPPGRAAWLLILFLTVAPAVAASAAGLDGAVVERAQPGYSGVRAGIRAGDVLLSWERDANPPANPEPARGVFTDPIDVRLVEWEQSGRGPMRLRGERAGEPIVFEMPGGDEWWLEMRPRLTAAGLAKLDRAQGLLADGELEAAQARWDDLVDELRQDGRLVAAAWLLRDLARQLITAGHAELGAGALDRAVETVRPARDAGALGYLLRERAWRTRSTAGLEAESDGYAEARRVWSAAPQPPRVGPLVIAEILANEGLVAWRMGDREGGRRFLLESLELRRRHAPASGSLASTLINLATVAKGGRAEEYLQEARAILGDLAPDGPRMSTTLNNLGKVSYERGHLRECVAYLEQALEFAERQDNRQAMTVFLANLSELSQARGDLVAAERYSERSLELLEEVSTGISANLHAVGSLHSAGLLAMRRGDPARARQLLLRAAEMENVLNPGSLTLAHLHTSLAGVALDQGEVDAAEEFLALAATWEPSDVGRLDALRLMGDLAGVEERLGRLDAARERLELASTLTPESGRTAPPYADLLARRADLHLRRGELQPAERLFAEALAIQEPRLPGTFMLAHTLHGLGSVQRRAGKRQEALEMFERAAAAVESQLARLGGDYESRARLGVRATRFYRDYIGLSLEDGQPARAFHLSERARARAFLDLLGGRELRFADLPRELDRELRAANVAYDRALGAARSDASGESAAGLERARAQRAEVQAKIRVQAPALDALQNPRPVDLDAARRALDPGTLLLSYVVAEEGSFLFAVGPGDGDFASHAIDAGSDQLRRQVSGLRQAVGPDGGGDFERVWAARLAATLLSPVGDQLARAERVLILPDGPLHDLPFAALPDPADPDRYLVEARPVSLALSATAFAEARRATRPIEAATVVAFGDPFYQEGEGGGRAVLRGLRSSIASELDLAPLPQTRSEIERLEHAFPGQTETYLGREASESRAKSVGGEAAILHFACHGVADERFPLESALALAMDEDPRGEGENGLLQAWEIFEQLRLDSELVTLSACNTALGKEFAGEGMIGLTRAFQFAGARSVMASLWAVSDRSTAELMGDFYARVRRGDALDEALRGAQVAMIRRQREASGAAGPFHWAAFQLHGDAGRPLATRALREP